ncbi:MAG: diacylglycerol kinase family protein [Planctomycetota bacterium]|nr:MAG: diacylglycerol kinase family protein [Planctomycetota bacterium]REJ89993.1 MAG: diacylglycerol kinase family protein [Planctomycetota bacterium]REK28225.1 MAG: diacylglycerol kinase family protein [Planctomycetota bacterium]REK39763.1 MAG: diacylglycerol kinase family protein [Planctomycetota bacterium]
MNPAPPEKRRGWVRKFADAFFGIGRGMRGQNSFLVHLPCAVAVLVLAALLPDISRGDWCLLILCISVVIAAELFNSAIEHLVAVVHPERHPDVGAALDIASAAVLICSWGAAVVGLIVLGPPLWRWVMSY